MPNYRRNSVPGGSFFFTLVTFDRRPIFATEANVQLLRRMLAGVRSQYPFEVTAAVILPDHLHWIWTLPENDSNFSRRIGRIKSLFTQSLGEGSAGRSVNRSRDKHREGSVWQRRFWEHTIRNEHDLQRHLDYIHYNPVKHGLVSCPHLWPHGSFAKWARSDAYASDWACICDGQSRPQLDFSDIGDTVGE